MASSVSHTQHDLGKDSINSHSLGSSSSMVAREHSGCYDCWPLNQAPQKQGDTPTKLSFRESFKMHIHEIKKFWKVAKEAVLQHPFTLILPVVFLCLVVTLGVWGVVAAADQAAQRHRDTVEADGRAIANSFTLWLQAYNSPSQTISALVRDKPRKSEVDQLFLSVAMDALSQMPKSLACALMVAPGGVVTNFAPTMFEPGRGLDVFKYTGANDTTRAVMAALSRLEQDPESSRFHVWGPFQISQDTPPVLVALLPVFVRAAANETWGWPGTGNCAQCYNTTSGYKFWGFTVFMMYLASVLKQSGVNPAIAALNYKYNLANTLNMTSSSVAATFEQFVRMNATVVYGSTMPFTKYGVMIDSSSSAKTGEELNDPVAVPMGVPGTTWTLYLEPYDGWGVSWKDGLVAMVVIASVIMSIMLFVLMVSRRSHKMLLEAIVPKAVIHELRSQSTIMRRGARSNFADGGTLADRIMGMMSDVLDGKELTIEDVVMVRTALLRSHDIYSPLCLEERLAAQKLDQDVTRALMQQLSAAPVINDRFSQAGQSQKGRRSSFVTYDGSENDHVGAFNSLTGALHTLMSSDKNMLPPPRPASTPPGGPGGAHAGAVGIPPSLWVAQSLSAAGAQHPLTLHVHHNHQHQPAAAQAAVQQRHASISGSAASTPGNVVANTIPRQRSFSLPTQGARQSRCGVQSSAASDAPAEGSGQLLTTGTGAALVRDGSGRDIESPSRGGSGLGVKLKWLSVATAPEPSEGDGNAASPRVQSRPHSRLGGGSTAAQSDVLVESAISLEPIAADAPSVDSGQIFSATSGPNTTDGPFTMTPSDGSLSHKGARTRGSKGSSAQISHHHQHHSHHSGGSSSVGGKAVHGGSAADMAGGYGVPPTAPMMEEVERVLAAATNTWEFDAFYLNEVTQGHPLSTLAYYLMQQSGLVANFRINNVMLARYLRTIEAGYQDNPYHNRAHASDVLQTMHVILTRGGFVPGYADPLTHLAVYMAAIIHDYEHVGLTNDFLVATSSPLALLYNDRSPLENHHVSAALTLLRTPGYNFMQHFSKADRDKFRKYVIELVMGTDMKQHFSITSHFTAVHQQQLATNTAAGAAPAAAAPQQPAAVAGGSPGASCAAANAAGRSSPGSANRPGAAPQAAAAAAAGGEEAPPVAQRPHMCVPVDEAERILSLQVALKVADLGHLAESLPVHLKWVNQLEAEFFLQGDKEKAFQVPVSPLFDRDKPGVTKSQVGFFDVCVLPLLNAFARVFPGCQPLLQLAQANYLHWKTLAAAANAAPAAPAAAPADAAAKVEVTVVARDRTDEEGAEAAGKVEV